MSFVDSVDYFTYIYIYIYSIIFHVHQYVTIFSKKKCKYLYDKI